jgi:hypothetical protein
MTNRIRFSMTILGIALAVLLTMAPAAQAEPANAAAEPVLIAQNQRPPAAQTPPPDPAQAPPAQSQTPPPAAAQDQEMPSTASPVPLVAVLGTLAISGALVVRRLRAH